MEELAPQPIIGPEHAEVYEVIYRSRGKDWPAEARDLTRRVRRLRHDARSLLDVACGTGAHLETFRACFDHVEGLELAPAMRERAERRLPGVRMHHADMRGFDLGRSFDVVICLCTSVGYLDTVEEMTGAVRCMADHLTPAGCWSSSRGGCPRSLCTATSAATSCTTATACWRACRTRSSATARRTWRPGGSWASPRGSARSRSPRLHAVHQGGVTRGVRGRRLRGRVPRGLAHRPRHRGSQAGLTPHAESYDRRSASSNARSKRFGKSQYQSRSPSQVMPVGRPGTDADPMYAPVAASTAWSSPASNSP